jgi:predicted small lipoprotein YifL
MSTRLLICALLAVVLLLSLAGCGGHGSDDGADAHTNDPPRTVMPVRCHPIPEACR